MPVSTTHRRLLSKTQRRERLKLASTLYTDYDDKGKDVPALDFLEEALAKTGNGENILVAMSNLASNATQLAAARKASVMRLCKGA